MTDTRMDGLRSAMDALNEWPTEVEIEQLKRSWTAMADAVKGIGLAFKPLADLLHSKRFMRRWRDARRGGPRGCNMYSKAKRRGPMGHRRGR